MLAIESIEKHVEEKHFVCAMKICDFIVVNLVVVVVIDGARFVSFS